MQIWYQIHRLIPVNSFLSAVTQEVICSWRNWERQLQNIEGSGAWLIWQGLPGREEGLQRDLCHESAQESKHLGEELSGSHED